MNNARASHFHRISIARDYTVTSNFRNGIILGFEASFQITRHFSSPLYFILVPFCTPVRLLLYKNAYNILSLCLKCAYQAHLSTLIAHLQHISLHGCIKVPIRNVLHWNKNGGFETLICGLFNFYLLKKAII
jgi:hypothetical protein